MDSGVQTQLIVLAIAIIVIARFLFRELRARTVNLSRLWVRPAILIALTGLVVWAAFQLPANAFGPVGALGDLSVSIAIGIVVGVIVGVLVSRSTSVETTGVAHIVTLRGSWTTVAIWVAALILRLGVRFAFRLPPTGAASTLTSAGTVAMVATAFTLFAVLIASRARALGAT